MTVQKRRRSFYGVSLVELLVASAIVGLLMLEIWKLVAAGSTFYHRVRSQGEVQRNTLLALRWIAKDLSSGTTFSFRQYDTDGTVPVTHPGIVFGSPSQLDSSSVAYDDRGRMLWSSIIGYYIDPSDNVLYRQQILLPESKQFPPTIDDDEHSTDVLAQRPAPRLVARHIKEIVTRQGPKDIRIELSSRDEELGFGIKVQTRLEMKN